MFGTPAETDRAAVALFERTRTLYFLDATGHVASVDLRDVPVDHKCLAVLAELYRLRNLTFQGNCIDDAVLARVSKLRSLERLDLRSCQAITDAGLHALKRLNNLKSLQLYDTAISDAGLAHLTGLKYLEELDLNATRVSDRGLTSLEEFPRLTRLNIGGETGITDKGLMQVSRLRALETLDLRGGNFSDEGIRHLGNLATLKRLYAGETRITSAGLRSLGQLSVLEILCLAQTQVADEGLGYLAGLVRLRHLNLAHTQVTDEGLPYLQGLKALRGLNLASTRVTNVGKKLLKRVLPKCIMYISSPEEIDVSRYDTSYFRDHPPSCLSGFRFGARNAEGDGRGTVTTWFELSCPCGDASGAVIGYPLDRFNPGYEGPRVFVSPLAFSCPTCGKVTEVIDTNDHGYDGEGGCSATIRGEGQREPFGCPHCGGVEMRVTVQFCYGGGELGLAEEDPDIRVEDFFGSFSADAICIHCGRTVHVADFETA
jgi:predicted RNA-binding Zn-ribbon protein involved in translation (DUF1610 family)